MSIHRLLGAFSSFVLADFIDILRTAMAHVPRSYDERSCEIQSSRTAQVGFFPHEIWKPVPSPLEVAVRVAALEPDTDASDDRRQEVSAAANWFFNGHRNKLTLDGSWLRVDDPVGARSGWRARLQWEISL